MSDKIIFYEPPYTEEEAFKFIKKVMAQLDRLKDLSDLESLIPLLKSFSQSYFDFEAYREKICELLVKKNFVQITSTMLDNLSKLDFFSDHSIWLVAYHIYHSLWNFCDASQKLATSILTTKIPSILLANILSQDNLDKTDDERHYFLLKSSISIVHNIARFPGNTAPFNLDNFKRTLVGLIKRHKSEFLALIAIMTLSVLVDETELSLLEEGTNTICVLIDHIEMAHLSDKKRSEGFTVWELVNSLRCISGNDNMKKTIFRQRGLTVLINVLKNSSNDLEIEKSLGTIWNLCYDNEVTDGVEVVKSIKDAISPFEQHSSAEIKRNYDGIMWLLSNKNNSVPIQETVVSLEERNPEIEPRFQYDVFISFAYEDKSIIRNIKEDLMKCNLRMSTEDTHAEDSALDIVTDKIKESRIVVIALSNSYRTSPRCRFEVEYAVSLNKIIIPLIVERNYKATSWLELVIGSKQTFDFGEQQFFNDTLRVLFYGIVGQLQNDNKHEPPLLLPGQHSVHSGSVVESWSSVDVQKWLNKSDLNHLLPKFETLHGPLLNSLVELGVEAPDFLYRTLQSDYEMSLMDILKFRLAMKNLSLD